MSILIHNFYLESKLIKTYRKTKEEIQISYE